MDLPLAQSSDTSDVFDDIVKNSTKLGSDYINSLKHCDNLVAAVWSFYYEKSIQNQTVNGPSTEFRSPIAVHVPLPSSAHRDTPEFNEEITGNRPRSTMGDSEWINPAAINMADVDEQISSMLANEQSMNFQTFEDPGMSFHPNMPGQVSLPYSHDQPQFNNSNQNYFDHVASPMANSSQQSNSYNCFELRYHPIAAPPQPVSPPCCYFGSTQVAPHMSHIQVQAPFDSEPPSLKKSPKKRPKRTAPSSPRTLRSINMNDWYVIDENGKKRRPLLYEFLRILLDNENYSEVAQYVDKEKGIFKFYQPDTLAELWELVKGRNADTSIILAFTKRSPIEIAEAIKSFHSELISIELIQHLIQYLPNDTEIHAFCHLSIDKEQISPADRLMYEIIQIPFYMERLNTLKFQLTFSDTCSLLNDQIQLVNEACHFLYQSIDIKKLLEIILSVLNHLNSTPTHRILTLDDLSKVCDLKTSKTRIPIMNIVSQICNDRHPEIFDLKQDYKLILSASKIELTSIQSEIEQIKQQSEQIQLWSNKFEDKNSLEKFLLDCQETLHELFRNYQTTNDQFHRTVSYFTKQTTTSTIFLSIFSNLIHSLKVQ